MRLIYYVLFLVAAIGAFLVSRTALSRAAKLWMFAGIAFGFVLMTFVLGAIAYNPDG